MCALRRLFHPQQSLSTLPPPSTDGSILGVVELDLDFEHDPSADWRVRRFELHEKLADPYRCVLDIAHEVVSGTAPDPKTLLGKPCCFKIIRHPKDSDPGTTRLVHGIVGSAEERGRAGNPEYVRAAIEIVPALWALSRRKGLRIFQDKDAPTIVNEVLNDALPDLGRAEATTAGLTHSDYPKRSYCLQYDETDLAFLQRLVQEEGISFYFEHPAADPEKIHLVDDNNEYVNGPALALPGQLADLLPARDLHTTKVSLYDRSWKAPAVDIVDDYPPQPLTPAPPYELEAQEPGQCLADPDGENSVRQAQLAYERARAQSLLASGRSIHVGVMPGQLSDITAPSATGKHLITEVRAWGTSPESFGLGYDDLGGETPYQNIFCCLPEGVPYRPERTRVRPRISGFQFATVLGDPRPPQALPEDLHPLLPEAIEEQIRAHLDTDGDGYIDATQDAHDYLTTDKMGRVRVHFRWDPQKRHPVWIRVMQPWAGAGFGAFFLPRTGMEVVVNFENGNPDKPLIVGCVHNELQVPPYQDGSGDNLVPEKSGIVTASVNALSTAAGTGYNELTFDDSYGNEKITIQAQKDMETTVKGQRTDAISGDDTKTVGGNHSVTISGNETINVTGNRKVNVTGEHNVVIEAPEEIWRWMPAFEGSISPKAEISGGGAFELKLPPGSLEVATGAMMEVWAGGKFELGFGWEYGKHYGPEHNDHEAEHLITSDDLMALRSNEKLALLGGNKESPVALTKKEKFKAGMRAFFKKSLIAAGVVLGAGTGVGGLIAALVMELKQNKKLALASKTTAQQVVADAEADGVSRMILEPDTMKVACGKFAKIEMTGGGAGESVLIRCGGSHVEIQQDGDIMITAAQGKSLLLGTKTGQKLEIKDRELTFMGTINNPAIKVQSP